MKYLSSLMFIVVLIIFATPILHAASLEGEWILVEQHYGSGNANILDFNTTMSLEFALSGAKLTAKIHISGQNSGTYDWPAFANDAGPLPIAIEERQTDLQKGSVAVRYRVKPSIEDDLILAVAEEYSITDGGNALVGKMEVTFMQGEEKRGSFILHRRFERKK